MTSYDGYVFYCHAVATRRRAIINHATRPAAAAADATGRTTVRISQGQKNRGLGLGLCLNSHLLGHALRNVGLKPIFSKLYIVKSYNESS